eukprot:7378431-Prymnesium_polylepis.1
MTLGPKAHLDEEIAQLDARPQRPTHLEDAVAAPQPPQHGRSVSNLVSTGRHANAQEGGVGLRGDAVRDRAVCEPHRRGGVEEHGAAASIVGRAGGHAVRVLLAESYVHAFACGRQSKLSLGMPSRGPSAADSAKPCRMHTSSRASGEPVGGHTPQNGRRECGPPMACNEI